MTAADLPAGPELDRKVGNIIGNSVLFVGFSTEAAEIPEMLRWLTKDDGVVRMMATKTGAAVTWDYIDVTQHADGDGSLPLALARLVVRVAEWGAGR